MAEHLRRLALTYLGVYGTLLVLLALTVGLAFIRMGILNPIVALTIAAAKALLIALFFMHLRHSTTAVKLAAAGGLVWLSLLFGLSLADYLTRPGERIFVEGEPDWNAPGNIENPR
ncbi:MAG: cytochrome C oxidase subunit IV family protein [Candidatus Competibacteraceae bacterium]|nr:cytochrome C oxidase subunit IV family protein [Candidatus Competibacteraceae bacterium]